MRLAIKSKGLREIFLFASASALLGSAKAVRAADIVPLYNLNLMGGQYFFQSQRATLNGNADGNVAPVVKFNDRWSLMPIYNIMYQGTKQVTDSVQAGTLYQQLMDNRLTVMGIYSVPETTWRLKPSVSVMREFIKETVDESWGNGLFDFWKLGAGFEAENVYKDPFSYRMGYDFYYIDFPDYKSLESQAGVDPSGNPLGLQTAGTYVLNTINNQLSFSATRPFPYDVPKASLQAAYSVNWQTYPDQPLVDKNGQPMSTNRQDFIQNLSFGAAVPTSLKSGGYRLVSRLGVGLAYDGSNANDYDATALKYVPDAYSYFMWSITPALNLSWGDEKNPTWTSIGFTFSDTRYSGRLAQDAGGNYTGSSQWQDRYLATWTYNYPIADHFSMKAQANFLWSTSNMAYQALYAYTYRTANYLFGFTYDY